MVELRKPWNVQTLSDKGDIVGGHAPPLKQEFCLVLRDYTLTKYLALSLTTPSGAGVMDY